MSTMTHARPIVNRTDTTDHAERFGPSAEDLAELGRWHAAHGDRGHHLGATPLEALEAPPEALDGCPCDAEPDDSGEWPEWMLNQLDAPNPRDSWPAWTNSDVWTLSLERLAVERDRMEALDRLEERHAAPDYGPYGAMDV